MNARSGACRKVHGRKQAVCISLRGRLGLVGVRWGTLSVCHLVAKVVMQVRSIWGHHHISALVDMRLASISAAFAALQTHCRRASISGLGVACSTTNTHLERGLCAASTSQASPDSSTWHHAGMAAVAAVAAGFAGSLMYLPPACAAEPQPAHHQKPDFEDPLVAAALQGVETGLEALTGGPGHSTQMGVATPWSSSEAWADLLQRRRLAENRLRGYLSVKQREVQAWIDQLHAMGRLTPQEFQAQMEKVEEEVNETSSAIMYGVRDAHARSNYLQKYGCTKPTEEALRMIAKYGPLIEIGGGLGHWQSMLASRGVDIISFDNFTQLPVHNVRITEPTFVGKVQKGDEQQVRKHSNRTLLLVYPGPDDMAANAVKLYKGRVLLYVGEPKGGVNATDEFFDLLQKDWEVVSTAQMEPFPEGYEQLWVLQRKGTKKGWLW